MTFVVMFVRVKIPVLEQIFVPEGITKMGTARKMTDFGGEYTKVIAPLTSRAGIFGLALPLNLPNLRSDPRSGFFPQLDLCSGHGGG